MTNLEIADSPAVPCPIEGCTHGDLYFGRQLCQYGAPALVAIVLHMAHDRDRDSEQAMRSMFFLTGLHRLRRVSP